MDLTAHHGSVPSFRRGSATISSDLSPAGSPTGLPPQQARRGTALSERRGSTSSLAVPTGVDSTVSQFLADDYDYGDVRPSPEGSATKERGNPDLKSNVSELRLDVSGFQCTPALYSLVSRKT